MLKAKLEEVRHRKKRQGTSGLVRCCRWLLRVLVNVIIIGLLGIGAFAIYRAQTISAEVKIRELFYVILTTLRDSPYVL